jgi:hypothetical protein
MISRESPPLLRNATKATKMGSTKLIPAAQYVRMSTEEQQYSIANQESAIADYRTQPRRRLAFPCNSRDSQHSSNHRATSPFLQSLSAGNRCLWLR